MAKVSKTYRFDEGLVARVAAYASERGSSSTDVFASGAEMLLAADSGVPDLPAAPVFKAPARIVRASKLAPADAVMSARQARLNRERS